MLALIYMASGFGRRFGSNKLLYELQGRPLYQWGFNHLHAAAKVLKAQLIVVSSYGEILDWCKKQQALVVLNQESREGMAASLRFGVAAAGSAEAYAFFVADQPYLTAETILKFLQGFTASGCSRGCFNRSGVDGSPAVFTAVYRQQLLGLKGDCGARSLLRAEPETVWRFTAPAEELLDIDTPDDVPAVKTSPKN